MRNVDKLTTKSFSEALKEANVKAEEFRDAFIALMPAAPDDEATWLTEMLTPETMRGLGSLMMLAGKNASWVQQTAQFLLSAIDKRVPAAIADAQANFTAGQVAAEMSCPCGDCGACIARRDLGDAGAQAAIEKTLAPKKPKGRIILTS